MSIPHPNDDADVPRILYLAGPMSAPGLPDDPAAWGGLLARAEYASYVQGVLLRQGYVTVNPYSTCISRKNWGTQPKEDWYHADLWLLTFCDGIVLLPGWEDSAGVVTKEIPFARQNALSIYVYNSIEDSLETYHG